ncbi:MAG: ATP-binding cassette domain-containing protein [Ruminococcus sp.]|nr:ATP-binding cassette domain-containing protein [Ruminococcus sp.]
MLINVSNIYKYFNGAALLRDINLTVENHETIGLIGSNGCGKTTLLNIITGQEEFDKTTNGLGSVDIANNINIGYLHQNSGLETTSTIREEMLKAFSNLLSIKEKMKQLEAVMSQETGDKQQSASEEYARLSAFFEARDGYRIDVKIQQILNGMGFSDTPDDRIISSLSGGEKTRLALAKLLLEEPDLLILDEPTNHLDFTTLMWLEDYLKSYKGSILIVSHDRYFLNKLCTRICEIENGKLITYKGNYSAYLLQKEMNSQRQLKEFEMQQKEISKLEDYIVRNKTRASTAKMAKSRQHALDRIDRVEKPVMYTKPPKINLTYDIEPTKDILQVFSCPVCVGSGNERKTLINSLDMHIRRGEHAAIIGPNGIGKTSILKMIQELIPHDSGNIIWGGNVKLSYFDQEHAVLNQNDTVIESVSNKFPSMSETEIRKALGSVLITGEDVFKPVSVLSGGERAKLCFCLMALNKGNVLVLDEPTNHIDLNTKEVLEEALAEFEGTIILVSHDRYLLNKVSNRIIEVTENNVTTYKGNFDRYSEQKMLERKEKEALLSAEKRKQDEENYKAKKQNQYRTRQQRALDAARRNRINQLEKEIEQLEANISTLEQDILLPEVSANFELMTEKCTQLEELRNLLDEKMNEWAELEQ